jgi:hypothetical protein
MNPGDGAHQDEVRQKERYYCNNDCSRHTMHQTAELQKGTLKQNQYKILQIE